MVSATEVVQEATRALTGGSTVGGKNTVAVEAVGVGAPPPNQTAPRSDQQAPAAPPTETADPNELKPAAQPDANELKPNAAPDANELRPTGSDSSAQAPPPLQQVNEIQPGTAANAPGQAAADAASSSSQEADDSAISSSKHKKKKGIKKVIPF